MQNFTQVGKAVILAVVALWTGSNPVARADLISFNPTGGQSIGGFNPGTSVISSLNFGSGDALAQGAITGGGLQAGSDFQLFYQTKVVALNGPSGALPGNAYAGLNSTYQLTEVGSVTERVQAISNSGGTAIVGVSPVQSASSGVSVYFQDLTQPGATPANAATGTGFNEGQLIMSKSPLSSQSSFTDTTKVFGLGTQPLDGLPGSGFPNTTTNQGVGGTNLQLSVVNGYNPSFFQTAGLKNSVFATNLRLNFDDILASTAFNDPTAAPGTAPSIHANLGSNNGTSGPDLAVQISGATENFAVPELPSFTMAATALVILPLMVWLHRRQQARRHAVPIAA